MKRNILVFLTALLFYSCNNEQSPQISDDIKVTSYSLNDFYITWNEFSGNKEPYRITYLVKGDILNKSQNIYKKSKISLDVLFSLDNGKEIHIVDMENNPFSMNFPTCYLYDWNTNTEKPFEIKSPRIEVEYATYPITKVTAIYSAETFDQINDKTETRVVLIEDITEKWKETVKRVKTRVSDLSPSQLNKLF